MALIDNFTDDDLLAWAAAFVRLRGAARGWGCLNTVQQCAVGKLLGGADEFLHSKPQPTTPRSTVAKQ